MLSIRMLPWDSADINHLGLEIDESAAARDRDEFGAIIVNLLGLAYCKDRGLPTDGRTFLPGTLNRLAVRLRSKPY